MTVKISTPTANYMLGTGSFRAAFSSFKLRLFSGPAPATADAAIGGGNTELCVFTESDDGTTGLTFEASVTSGVLRKTVAEDWATTVAANGVATFYRICVGSDDGSGSAGGSDYRIQGTVGDANNFFDLVLSNATLAISDTISISSFQLRQPQAGA